jgi:hypothetical protein
VRVALCFSGLPRFVFETHSYWKQCILDPYTPDVFIHSWQTLEFDPRNFWSLYHPKILAWEQPKQYDVSLYTERIWAYRTVPQNQVAQYTGIQKAIGLAIEYQTQFDFEYDIIVRARFDWFLKKIDFEKNNCVNVAHTPGLKGHRFKFLSQEHLGISDQFAYGNSSVMKTYAQLVDWLPTLYQEYKVDFCGELFLKSHLLLHNTPVKEHHWHNGIVRPTGINP